MKKLLLKVFIVLVVSLSQIMVINVEAAALAKTQIQTIKVKNGTTVSLSWKKK